MNLLTIVVLAFLVVSSIVGMKRGMIKTLFSLFSVVVALILAAIFSPIAANILQNNEKIVGAISDSVEAIFFSDDQTGTDNSAQSKDILEDLEIPEKIKELLRENNTSDAYEMLNADTLKAYICNYISFMIIKALAFVLLFVAFMIALALICTSLNLISKLPVLNGVNHMLGLLCGFAFSLVIVWVMCVALTALASTTFGGNMMAQINESEILSFIYNHNLLINNVTDVF